MAIDTPARLAVLGAGPVGIEAALYARFLGYDVVVYEQGELAAAVRARGNERMSAPFGMNRTTLGLAAIEAQDEAYRPPGDEELLTGNEWIDRYLAPLAASDLVSDHLRLHTQVIAVGQEQLPPEDMPEDGDEGEWAFRVVSTDATGAEHKELFDGVLDCTGAQGSFRWLDESGSPSGQPNYYVLGAKSRGGHDELPMTEAHDQIRDAFKIIGDREGLDLYASTRRLVK